MLFSAIMNTSEDSAPGPTNDFWYQPLATSSTGVRVTPLSAMRASACYACVKVLAETIASLPRIMAERMTDGTVMPRPQHPLQDVLELSPNGNQTAFEFWEMQIAFGCLYGNSYAEIIPGARGAVDQLKPLRPDCVTVQLLDNGRIRYTYRDPITAAVTIYNQDEIFKIPGFSFNGIEGIAPIFFAQDPIGLALATEQFGCKFFTNDATPALVLEHPKTLSPGAVDRIKRTFKDLHAGLNNAYSVAVLEEDMKVHSLGVPNKDAQFLETRKHQIAEIARYMRVPLHMINELEKSAFSNIEQQSIEFVKYTIRPWLKRIEQRVGKDLITNNKFFLRHDLDDLMQGEMLPRYQAYQIAATVGFMARNEIRRKEGLNPLDGLDEPLTPMNMGQGQGGADNQPAPSRTPQGGNGASAPDAAQGCAIAVRDAFDRITASELANLKALSKKAMDPNAAIDVIENFYQLKHAPYMVKALTPCQQLCESFGLQVPKVESYVEMYSKHRAAEVLAADDVVVYLDTWIKTASANLASGWFTQGETAQ